MDSLRREDHQELNIGIDGHINIDDNRVEKDTHQSVDSEKGSSSAAGTGELGKDMAPMAGNSIHRSSSRPQLDLSGAAIQGNFEEKDPSILLPNQSDDISHLALDIGGISMHFLYRRFVFLWGRGGGDEYVGCCSFVVDLVNSQNLKIGRLTMNF